MFDRLLSAFSSPSLPKLAKAVTGRLAARGATDIVYDEALKEIRATSNGATCAISLANLWPQYQSAAASNRSAVLERFVSGVIPGAANELPVDYASARSRILPIVRQAADDALAQLMSQRLMTKGDDVESLGSASQVLLDDKVVGVAFDAPDALTRLTRKQLRDWGVSLDAVLSDALHNLRGLPEHAGWQQVAPGLWSGQWGDSYESSRVLLPDLIYRVGITDPVALVPLRDCLLIASVKDESALLAMVNHARERMDNSTRWLSPVPMRLVDSRWESFEPPAACQSAFDEMATASAASVYQGQKEALEALFDPQKQDIFVATASLIKAPLDGALRTYCVWSRGVDSLLPKTDLVMFHGSDSPQRGTVIAPWSQVSQVVGDLLESTSHVPVRYRVRAFPDDDRLARMKRAPQVDGA